MKRAPPPPIRVRNTRSHKRTRSVLKFRNHQFVLMTMNPRFFPNHTGKLHEAKVMFSIYDCHGYLCQIMEYDESYTGSYVVCSEKFMHDLDRLTQLDHYRKDDHVLFKTRSEKRVYTKGIVIEAPDEDNDTYCIQYREWNDRSEKVENRRVYLSRDQIYWIR